MNSFLLFIGGVAVGVFSVIGMVIYLIATADKFYDEDYEDPDTVDPEVQDDFDELEKDYLFDKNSTIEVVWPNGGYIKDEKGNSVPIHYGWVEHNGYFIWQKID